MAKALILYSSKTGNTKKVACCLRKSFQQYDWQVDTFKIGKNWKEKPIVINRYDLLCVGSLVHWSLPSPWLVELLRSQDIPHRKIIPGPQGGVAFATYGGAHLGFKAIGRLAIPGKMGKALNPQFYHPDLHSRPDKNDMGRVASFVEKLHQRSELISLR